MPKATIIHTRTLSPTQHILSGKKSARTQRASRTPPRSDHQLVAQGGRAQDLRRLSSPARPRDDIDRHPCCSHEEALKQELAMLPATISCAVADALMPIKETLTHTLAVLPATIGCAVADAYTPVKQALTLAQSMTQEPKVSRAQKIAQAIKCWVLPVVQVLLGAAVLALGVVSGEVSFIVLGATTCCTGLAVCANLLAGMVAPHPFDRMKKFFERREVRNPEPFKTDNPVVLDSHVTLD